VSGTISFLENYIKMNKPNFFHFVGIFGKNIINKFKDNNISMMSFLSELKKINLKLSNFFLRKD